MTLIKRTLFTLVVAFYIIVIPCNAQFEKEEQQTFSFSKRIRKPIEIEVIRKDGELDFYAQNNSFYPYQVSVDFTTLTNLRIYIGNNKTTVMPGRHKLLTLTIVEKNTGHNYSYKTTYTLGDPNDKPDADHPYLIPLREGKYVERKGFYLKTEPGDTIYAMRKGLVTAVPKASFETDRIFNNSLEIYHKDGTVAAYQNVNPDTIFVDYGDWVYPGQPIALASNTANLGIYVLYFLGDGKITRLKHKYAISETETASFEYVNSKQVLHPLEIVKRELTKGELKRLAKGTLYGKSQQDSKQ